MHDKQLCDVLDEYWRDFKKKHGRKDILNHSIPIVWFGDMEAYTKSQLKIVTIGLNPSNHEFYNDDGTESNRFSDITTLTNCSKLVDRAREILVANYNNYFKVNPYKKWFDNYKDILNIFSADYYGTAENTAIHIDLETSLATNPTWSKLTNEEQESIRDRDLSIKLLDYLKPDIMLISANKKVRNFLVGESMPFYETYVINGQEIMGYDIEGKLYIYGTNSQFAPFAYNFSQKRVDVIREIFDQWLEIKKP